MGAGHGGASGGYAAPRPLDQADAHGGAIPAAARRDRASRRVAETIASFARRRRTTMRASTHAQTSAPGLGSLLGPGELRRFDVGEQVVLVARQQCVGAPAAIEV